MIHNVYGTGNPVPTSSELQPIDKTLLVDMYKFFSLSMLLFPIIMLTMYCLGTSTFIIPFRGGPRARSYFVSQLLLSLQELHDLAPLLPAETITCRKMGVRVRFTLYFLQLICLTPSQLAAQERILIMGLTISPLKLHFHSLLLSLILSLSHSGER